VNVEFRKGVVRKESGEESPAQWAVSPFGVRILLKGAKSVETSLAPFFVLTEELFAEIDLPGVDREGVEAIADGLLLGGYLERDDMKDKGDALLFILVNEALHALAAADAPEYDSFAPGDGTSEPTFP
jgi:hypothetical protein